MEILRTRLEISWRDDEKYSGKAERGRQRLYTHGGGEHRWKQSGIRDDVRPWHRRKGKWPGTRGKLLFKIKPEIDKTKKPKTRHPSPRCDINTNKPITVHKTDVSTINNDPNKNCPLHDKPHPLKKCRTFRNKSIDDRKAFLKQKGICFKCCSSTSHVTKDCKSSVKCFECEGTYHDAAMHPLARPEFFELFAVENKLLLYHLRTCSGIMETYGRKAEGFQIVVGWQSSHLSSTTLRVSWNPKQSNCNPDTKCSFASASSPSHSQAHPRSGPRSGDTPATRKRCAQSTQGQAAS